METVNNLTSAASRAIWGDPNKTAENEEPVSGQTGDVSAGEPYDKGNEEPISTSNTESTNPTTSSAADTNATTSDMPSTTTSSSSGPSSSNDTSGSGPTPSVGAAPSAPQDTQTQADTDKPTGSEEHERIKETQKEAEEAAEVGPSGPGSKPLSEVKGGGATEGEKGSQKEIQGEGTAQKYVKRSGVKADGGDFDAANAGAAQEADRLLQTKGVHREAPGTTDTSSKTDSKESDAKDTSESGGKLSGLKEKIKAKLHKNKD